MAIDINSELKHSKTIMDVLSIRANIHPDKKVFTDYHFLPGDKTDEDGITYSELDLKAREIAMLLQKRGAFGEKAILLYPPGIDFVIAFMGCLYAGVIAVPAYPPYSSRMLERFQSIALDCGAKYLLTTESILPVLKSRPDGELCIPESNRISTDVLETKGADTFTIKYIQDKAFVQYTSGSTSEPKGVGLTHRNLLENSRSIQYFFGTTEDSRSVSWLPQYHDMGLIGGIIQTIYCGGSTTLFSPLDFLKKPIRWLRLISDTRATISGGPNFAYDLCARKAAPEMMEGIDLSSWSLAFNGAEPISHETLGRFYEVFKPYGFRYEAFFPCYGLAESTLIVSGREPGGLPTIKAFDKDDLENLKATENRLCQDNVTKIVGCGKPEPQTRLMIVNPDTEIQCQPAEIGEIWVQSKSCAKEYLHKPNETKTTFQAYLSGGNDGPYLRTGDLGFIDDGELFITGRLKDLVIIRGKNYYPNDIEDVIGKCHDRFRPGCSAAFSVEHYGEEKLVIVQEVRKNGMKTETEDMRDRVYMAVSKYFRLQVHDVVFIKERTIPKTSSGKIRRHACKENYLQGKWKKKSVDFDEFKNLVSEGLGIERELLTRKLSFRDDMGIDSLSVINFLVKIEHKYKLKFDVESIWSMKNLGEIYDKFQEELEHC